MTAVQANVFLAHHRAHQQFGIEIAHNLSPVDEPHDLILLILGQELVPAVPEIYLDEARVEPVLPTHT